MNKIKSMIQTQIDDYRVLMRSVPPLVMMFLAISTTLMNLMAQKELLNISWLALDCGFLLSWLSFLCMDMLTKRFGAKAAIQLSLTSVMVSLFVSLVLFVTSVVGNNWSAAYNYENNDNINAALNETFGGTWYVIAGSMIAFAVAAIVNAVVNESIGKMTKKNNFRSFALRSYVSTAIGQFVDNFVFATVVSKVFFGWTWQQVFFCSIAGAVAELISEVIFSPVGFKVCRKWEKHNVGHEYLDYVNSKA